jgi:capsular exopolysaccharide synthesis family protein
MKNPREISKRSSSESEAMEVGANASGSSELRHDGPRDGSFVLLDYWRTIRKRLWLILGITFLVTALTAVYMARKSDVFESTVMVQVDLEQANPDLVTSDRRARTGNSDPAYFNTQLQLLSSDNLIRRVIKEFSLDTNPVFLREFAKSESSAIGSILRTVGLASDGRSGEKSTKEGKLTGVNSEEIAEAVRLSPYVTFIKNSLAVEPVRESRATVKDTRLIQIAFRTTDSDLAALIANGVGETFTIQNQEKRTGSSKKTNDFLRERVTELQSSIKDDELKLADLKRSSGIINLDENQTLVINTLAGLNKLLLEAENARKLAEAEFNAVRESPERLQARAEADTYRYVTERENAIQTIKNKAFETVTTLRADREKLLVEFQPTALEIIEIDRKIEAVNRGLTDAVEKNNQDLADFRRRARQTILDNLRTRFNQTRAQEEKVRADFQRLYDQAQGQNAAAINIRLLEQNISTNKGFLENLTKQQSENDVIAQGTENNISIAEVGIPGERPVAPRRLLTVVIMMVASLLFGAGLAIFLEYLDDTIKSAEEIESYLRLPALATIPSIDSQPKSRLLLVGEDEEAPVNPESTLLVHSDPKSAIAEAYRQLRTSILLSTAGHPPKSLLVTSSLPADGKTTTAINTATSLAQTGAKVIMIDADMRRPRVHSMFGMTNDLGLSTALSSEPDEEVLLEMIQYDEVSNLYVLPSGPIPPNPAELLGSSQMLKILDILEKNFDHTVVDSPPIASFTDGVLISSMVDGVILVVHAGKGSRQIIRRAKNFLEEVGAKIFGVVLNNVNLKNQGNHYYHQQYQAQYYHRED